MMYRIAVIGERDVVLGFRAIGMETVAAENAAEAAEALHRMAKEDYAIIYITEDYASAMSREIERYAEQRTPAVIPIPGRDGPCGVAAAAITAAVERAVGADIK
jgi:V/A-type H+-transporting ATPase subunit F